MKNKMSDLRDHLFDVLERLKDPDPATPMTIETAKMIVDVADTLVDTARVENDYLHNLSKLYPEGLPQNQQKALGGWIGDPGKTEG